MGLSGTETEACRFSQYVVSPNPLYSLTIELTAPVGTGRGPYRVCGSHGELPYKVGLCSVTIIPPPG